MRQIQRTSLDEMDTRETEGVLGGYQKGVMEGHTEAPKGIQSSDMLVITGNFKV